MRLVHWMMFSGLVFSSTVFPLEQTGPHGGEVVRDGKRPYEVSVDHGGRRVDVFTPPVPEETPSRMAITIFKAPDTGRTIQLKAVSPLPDGYLHYQGELALEQQSFMGFELQFDIESTKHRVAG